MNRPTIFTSSIRVMREYCLLLASARDRHARLKTCFSLHSNRFINFLHDIDAYVEQYDGVDTSMEMPDIGNFCLAKIDGKYNRAKILSNSCQNGVFCAQVFCCDIGTIHDCEIENIMSIPDSLLHSMPLQAIWCRLYGIKPTEPTNGHWTEEISLKIYDDFIDPICNLTAKMISVHAMDPILPDSPYEMQQIDIVLMADESAVNRLIVDRGWAIFEPDAERIIAASCALAENGSTVGSDNEESEDEEWKEAGIVRRMPIAPAPEPDSGLLQSFNNGTLDIHFDFGEFEECIDESMRHLFQVPNAIVAELNDANALEREPTEAKHTFIGVDSSLDSDDCDETSFNQPTMNNLRYKYRVPYVTWKQSDELIVLAIKADENVAYNVYVTDERLIFK